VRENRDERNDFGRGPHLGAFGRSTGHIRESLGDSCEAEDSSAARRQRAKQHATREATLHYVSNKIGDPMLRAGCGPDEVITRERRKLMVSVQSSSRPCTDEKRIRDSQSSRCMALVDPRGKRLERNYVKRYPQ
jgi:hypothetical protein